MRTKKLHRAKRAAAFAAALLVLSTIFLLPLSASTASTQSSPIIFDSFSDNYPSVDEDTGSVTFHGNWSVGRIEWGTNVFSPFSRVVSNQLLGPYDTDYVWNYGGGYYYGSNCLAIPTMNGTSYYPSIRYTADQSGTLICSFDKMLAIFEEENPNMSFSFIIMKNGEWIWDSSHYFNFFHNGSESNDTQDVLNEFLVRYDFPIPISVVEGDNIDFLVSSDDGTKRLCLSPTVSYLPGEVSSFYNHVEGNYFDNKILIDSGFDISNNCPIRILELRGSFDKIASIGEGCLFLYIAGSELVFRSYLGNNGSVSLATASSSLYYRSFPCENFSLRIVYDLSNDSISVFMFDLDNREMLINRSVSGFRGDVSDIILSFTGSMNFNCLYGTFEENAFMKFLRGNSSFYDPYQSGYDFGYAQGEDAGYNSGYDEGWDCGVLHGQDIGYERGLFDGKVSAKSEFERDWENRYQELRDEIYQEAYNEGHGAGYAQGEDAGYNSGYDEGMNSNQGYFEGYDKGVSDTQSGFDSFGGLLNSIINAPFVLLGNILNFNIFGINIWMLCCGLITVGLVIFLLKKLGVV